MAIVDLTQTEPDRGNRERQALDDVRHRLLSLAASLALAADDEAALRRAAGELESVVRRIHWLADISTSAQRAGELAD